MEMQEAGIERFRAVHTKYRLLMAVFVVRTEIIVEGFCVKPM